MSFPLGNGSLSSEFDPRETNTQSSLAQTINPFYYISHQMVKVFKFIGNDNLHAMLISVAKNRRYGEAMRIDRGLV